MKTSLLGGCTAVALFLCGCSLWHKHSSAPKPSAATSTEPAAATKPATATVPATTAEPVAADEPATEAESDTVAESATAPQPAATPQSKATPKLKAQTETLTGKVVLVGGGYRLKLADDESGKLFRLTRAKRNRDFAVEQINLRKYYEKTIVVRGKREDDWIWSAEIVGQWNKPGESRGPNLLAPPAPNR